MANHIWNVATPFGKTVWHRCSIHHRGRAGRGLRTAAPGSANNGPINLVVATPCFGGQISAVYALSLLKLQTRLRGYRDCRLKVLMKDGDALITRARASLLSQFLDDASATHLLFIDADIGFEPEQVFRLIECGAEMCAAVYPIKRIDWRRMRACRAAAQSGGIAELCRRSRGSECRDCQFGFHQGPLRRHRISHDPAGRA